MAMGRDDYPRSFRCSRETWEAATARADAEGIQLTSMIRQFVEDFAAGQTALRAKVRTTLSERAAIAEALGGLDIGAIVVDAINKERE